MVPNRSGPHANPILLQRKSFISLLYLGVKLTQMLYIPWVGQRHSIFCGEANAPGPAYLCNLEGPFLAGGKFVEPCPAQDPSEDEVASLELAIVHEPLMIAPERLVVACISDCCSPPSALLCAGAAQAAALCSLVIRGAQLAPA